MQTITNTDPLYMGFETAGAQLYNDDAERALIGAVLVADYILDEPKVQVVEPEDFFIPTHRTIWRGIKNLKQAGSDVDTITLQAEYERMGEIKNFDLAYLMSCTNAAITSIHGESYAEIILEFSARRRALKFSNEIANRAFDLNSPIIDTATFAMAQSGQILRTGGEAVHWSRAIERVREAVELRKEHPSEIWGLASGIKDLDYAMGGFQVGLNILAGSPGAGKSILFNQILLQMATGIGEPAEQRRFHPVGLFSMEMDEVQNTRRNLSALAKIATRKLKTGFITDAEYKDFLDQCQNAARIPIYQSDRNNWTIPELRAELARLKREYHIEAAMIDYLFLMVSGVNLRMEPYQKAEWLTGELKKLAGELDLVLLVINSVTKEQMRDETPGQAGMKGGGQVNHDADMTAMLTSYKNPTKPKPGQIVIPEEYVPNVRALWITKGREIENNLSRVLLYKHPQYPFFADMVIDGQLNWDAIGQKTVSTLPRPNSPRAAATAPAVYGQDDREDDPPYYPGENQLAF